uniref:Nucleotide-diphospho-sugar transferase domain-containing protein n=1 Tax=Chromera velia CCMP2878 TaxID=1169474 RepID=A0A0G4HZD0_9ALVE|mmetsp:Transcript_24103/g.47313  ORF Transcript_24103/g.47313 Transcript_24103/m.47313 type:complete len:936 (-) Transcript_24103:202-3009(-)|eukprot:Cvel_9705.t1-p1 / transcript=Cvel_9705.t1 / gene=Cvel_9705 / organism=Chromera_velia_CCMP2878 / gene_product=hypothetical protein / transcript_product=hypothetical protein / location=Cvel_scaffold566:5529-12116(+) / protein_length=935 / sequence_SO=supercontig / SO=protein_coding / is_pseudo=false
MLAFEHNAGFGYQLSSSLPSDFKERAGSMLRTARCLRGVSLLLLAGTTVNLLVLWLNPLEQDGGTGGLPKPHVASDPRAPNDAALVASSHRTSGSASEMATKAAEKNKGGKGEVQGEVRSTTTSTTKATTTATSTRGPETTTKMQEGTSTPSSTPAPAPKATDTSAGGKKETQIVVTKEERVQPYGKGKEGEAVQILMASDVKGLPHVLTTLESYKRMSGGERAVVWLLLDDKGGSLGEDRRKILKQRVEETGVGGAPKIQFNLVPFEAEMKYTQTLQHVPFATMCRLLAPDLLPSSLKRVVYLDFDLMVLGPLRALMEDTGLPEGFLAKSTGAGGGGNETAIPREVLGGETWKEGGCGIAARSSTDKKVIVNWLKKDKLDGDILWKGERSFNAGVLLMDLESLRRNNFTDRAKQWVGKWGLNDQLVLNFYCNGTYTELPKQWNIYAGREQIPRDVHIIHFAGPPKPWKPRWPHPSIGALWHRFAQSFPGTGKPAAPASPLVLVVPLTPETAPFIPTVATALNATHNGTHAPPVSLQFLSWGLKPEQEAAAVNHVKWYCKRLSVEVLDWGKKFSEWKGVASGGMPSEKGGEEEPRLPDLFSHTALSSDLAVRMAPYLTEGDIGKVLVLQGPVLPSRELTSLFESGKEGNWTLKSGSARSNTTLASPLRKATPAALWNLERLDGSSGDLKVKSSKAEGEGESPSDLLEILFPPVRFPRIPLERAGLWLFNSTNQSETASSDSIARPAARECIPPSCTHNHFDSEGFISLGSNSSLYSPGGGKPGEALLPPLVHFAGPAFPWNRQAPSGSKLHTPQKHNRTTEGAETIPKGETSAGLSSLSPLSLWHQFETKKQVLGALPAPAVAALVGQGPKAPLSASKSAQAQAKEKGGDAQASSEKATTVTSVGKETRRRSLSASTVSVEAVGVSEGGKEKTCA